MCGMYPQKRCSVYAASVIAETGDASIKPDYICKMTETLGKLTVEKYGNCDE